ncbi:MAG: phosphate/phosphite/phosphonate ABC transporter substrate-binding protein [Thermodesulfobacteriota bacterium]
MARHRFHKAGWYGAVGFVCATAASLFIGACGSDVETRTVDFSVTVDVGRPTPSEREGEPLKVAVAAMVSPRETAATYRELLDYLGRRLGKEVQLVQRKTYGEINELLGTGHIDIAFICSGPYAAGRDRYGLHLVATPEVNGDHFYKSYLIVNASSSFRTLEDLRHRTFAFTDPDSNTGRLIPLHWLAGLGEQPDSFFEQTIYTYSHDNSILAVARGLVDAAAVDSLIWEYYARKMPSLTALTRVIKRSEPYGIPPVVASSFVLPDTRDKIRRVLLSMHGDPNGRKILDELLIDRFIEPRDEWYDSIRKLRADLVHAATVSHVSAESQR